MSLVASRQVCHSRGPLFGALSATQPANSLAIAEALALEIPPRTPVPQLRLRSPLRATPLALAFVTTGLLAAPPRIASASPTGTTVAADAKAAAKARFERAVRLFEDGNYEAALVEFRTSIGDYPTRTAAVNITICFRKLGRYDEEKDALDELERSFPTTKRSELESLARARAEVADRLGTVAFSNLPPGTQITIDGRERGETPLAAPIAVSAGIRTVRATKRGYRPFERRVDVPARKDIVLSAGLEEEPSAPAVVAPAPAPPKALERTRAPVWPGIALAAGGVVAGGVGVFVLSSRESVVSDAKALGCAPGLTSAALFSQCQTLEDRSRTRGTLGAVFLAGGGALVAGGLLYWVARGGKDAPAPSQALRCAPGASQTGFTVGCMGEF